MRCGLEQLMDDEVSRSFPVVSPQGLTLLRQDGEHDSDDSSGGLYHDLVSSDRLVSLRWSLGPEDGVDTRSIILPAGLCDDCQPTYSALLKRGVTLRMIGMYRLEWSDALGIVAWVDRELFNEFRLPAMEDGERWKIYLGRRIRFTSEAESDGRELMRSVLENLDDSDLWTTFREGTDLWTTGPSESTSFVPAGGQD